jgi:hypothetical protein
LALDTLDPSRIGDAAETWEKVVAKLRSRTMPPAGLPRPDGFAYDQLAGSLEAALDLAAAAAPNPGRSVLHRLNRAEYTNAIRDLLALDVDGDRSCPPTFGLWFRQHLRSALGLTGAARARYDCGGQDQPAGDGEPSTPPSDLCVRPTLLRTIG